MHGSAPLACKNSIHADGTDAPWRVQRMGLLSVTMAPTLNTAVAEPPRHLKFNKEPAMSDSLIKHTNEANFEADVLQPNTNVLVDFWAEWCGPCKMIAPVLEEVSVSYKEKLQIAKVNVDENRTISAKFGIRGIPTLMLFKNGQLAATKVGALNKSQLTAFLDEQLA